MLKPNIPENEKQRLESLHALSILDTDEEERFDRITRMAKRLFDVSIALVSLVDENRQWFKSCVGLSVSEMPRDISFCGHAILDDDVFIIPETLNDERFVDNPLVIGAPKIRFYAGCPLKTSNGEKIGTLCIIDQKPRAFSDDDIAALKDLAAMVETELTAIQQATRDYLTGTLNRRGFIIVAQHSLQLCIRQQVPASLVFFDLDKLKLINDSFGHSEGDAVLITFVNQLETACRDSDVVGRLSGDEFVCLIANSTKQQAEQVITRFKQSLAASHHKKNSQYYIEFSYGIAEFDLNKHNTLAMMLEEADALMYNLKKSKETAR